MKSARLIPRTVSITGKRRKAIESKLQEMPKVLSALEKCGCMDMQLADKITCSKKELWVMA
jgi:ABC-type ATPase involved in cell division